MIPFGALSSNRSCDLSDYTVLLLSLQFSVALFGDNCTKSTCCELTPIYADLAAQIEFCSSRKWPHDAIDFTSVTIVRDLQGWL